MKIVNKSKCWICNRPPSTPTAAYLYAIPKEQREWYCKSHYKQAHTPNPFITMIKKDAY